MPIKIAILGAAGTLGSCTAYRLAVDGLADELVMIDVNRNMLKSHVWDIETAVTGMQDINIREGDDEDLADSDIVINNAGAPWRVVASRMEKLHENMTIIKDIAHKIKTFCPGAVVITSTNPVDPLNIAMQRYSGLDRQKLLGYTLNDCTRFKCLAAKALNSSSTRVQGTVIGEHGNHAVLLFSTLRIDGHPAELDDATKTQIRSDHQNVLKNSIRLGTGWTSGWTSSVGLATIVSALTGRTGDPLPCSVILEGEYGASGISMSVPVKLEPEGIKEIVALDIRPDEKKELDNSIAYLQEINEKMNAYLDE